MPRVPQLDNFGVQPNQLPGVQVRPVAPRVDPGQQLQQFGQQVERTGAKVMDFENEELKLANQLRVDDALNKALEVENRLAYDPQAGFTSQKGLAALERASGKPLADEYTEELGKEYEAIAGTLGNDWQRQQFAINTQKRAVQFRGAAMRHESQEFKTYALSVREGTISNRMNQIGLNYNNPEVIDEAITSIRAATHDMARLQGHSAEWTEAQSRKMVSNAHKVALATAIEKNDITFADDYLKKYGKDMDADDLLQARGLITKEMDLRVGVGAATAVMGKVAPRIVTSDFDRLVNITMASESGGRRFGADGQLLTSPKGAKGEMQVMDATNGDPGYGVKPAQDDSPEERARVGRDYLAAMVREHDGDLAKAWAAYNAGPGAVQKAVREADAMVKMSQRDPSLPAPNSWLELMPQETRDYVEKNLRAYGAGQGQSAKPTMAEIDAELARDPQLAGNPARLKAARDEAKRQFDAIEAARKQREEEGVAVAMQELVANGGDFKALTATQRAMIPADKLDNVLGFAEKIRKGDDKTSEALYQKLATDQKYLASLSDNAFYALRRELSESDFKHFANERAKLTGRAPTNGNSPQDLNTAAIKDGVNLRLQQLGIDPTPKDGSKDAQRVGAVRQYINNYIATAQAEAGKKLTDVELAQHLDALFAKNVTLRGYFSDSSGPMLSMKPGDIPSAAREKLRAAFKLRGVDDPTDAQLLNAYWTAQASAR